MEESHMSEMDQSAARAADAVAVPPGPLDTGLTCLSMIAGFHGIAVDEAQLRHAFSRDGHFNTQDILFAARSVGLTAKPVRQDISRFDRAPLPAVAQDKDGQYFIIAKFDSGSTPVGKTDNSTAPVNTTARLLIQRPGAVR